MRRFTPGKDFRSSERTLFYLCSLLWHGCVLMKSPRDGYFWAFPAQVPACLRSVGNHNLRRHSTKKSPLHRGWARPSHSLCLPRHTPQTCCFSPGHTSLSAPNKHRNPLQNKMHFRHFSSHFLAMCASDVCTGIDKVSVKGVYQAPKKFTSMVRGTG